MPGPEKTQEFSAIKYINAYVKCRNDSYQCQVKNHYRKQAPGLLFVKYSIFYYSFTYLSVIVIEIL